MIRQHIPVFSHLQRLACAMLLPSKRRHRPGVFLTAPLVLALLFGGQTHATMLTVDEILYESGDNPAVLSGTVDMSVSGNTLTIVLTNTSSADAGSDGAGNLLVGLGFDLPSGVTISSGSVDMTGSTAINFTFQADVSSEWGYHNGAPTQGHFLEPAVSVVNTVVSSQINDGTTQFVPGSIGNPPILGGPDFGLASPNAGIGGQHAVLDHVTITLELSGTVPADFIDQIEANPIILAFGSPKLSTVPEPSGFLLATVCGLLSTGGVLRRRRGRV